MHRREVHLDTRQFGPFQQPAETACQPRRIPRLARFIDRRIDRVEHTPDQERPPLDGIIEPIEPRPDIAERQPRPRAGKIEEEFDGYRHALFPPEHRPERDVRINPPGLSIKCAGLERWRASAEAHHIVRIRAHAIAAIEAHHRLVGHQHLRGIAEAIEAGLHRSAIGAQHADFDVVAGLNVARECERALHVVRIVAGRPIEGEILRCVTRIVFQRRHRETPIDMRCIVERAIGAIIDVELFATALFDLHDHARIFRAQRTAGFAPQLGVVGDRQRLEVSRDHREIVF